METVFQPGFIECYAKLSMDKLFFPNHCQTQSDLRSIEMNFDGKWTETDLFLKKLTARKEKEIPVLGLFQVSGWDEFGPVGLGAGETSWEQKAGMSRSVLHSGSGTDLDLRIPEFYWGDLSVVKGCLLVV